jgi:type IV fimbrial biogenesis protein FimT
MDFMPKNRPAGYTLVEVLVTLALLAMLAQMGSSSFSRLTADLKLATSVNNLVHVFQLARQLSWTIGEDVVLCKSRDQRNCQDDASWNDGWVLFSNLDQDNPPAIDPNEPVHRSSPSIAGISISANRRAFVMRPFGMRATNGTLTYCDKRLNAAGRAVVVSYTGKARIIRTRQNGAPIVCPSR